MAEFPVPNSSAWNAGLCDCCEVPKTSCQVFCCPCLAFGEIAQILDHGKNTKYSHAIKYCVAGCFSPLFTCTYRRKLRRRYGLPAKPCNDLFVDYCCLCCSLVQQHRELKSHGVDPNLAWRYNQPGYDPPSSERTPTAPISSPAGQRMSREMSENL